MKASTEDELVRVAQEHGGRYLITLMSWHDEDAEWKLCDALVKAHRARWLEVPSPSWGGGEPGPGIQLIGRDAIGVKVST